jgi:ketosteroid isomerase-like protein
MKRMAIAVCVVVLVFGVAIPAQQKSGTVEQEQFQLEQDWTKALIKADVAFLDRLVAEDWVFTDPEGVVWTKAQSLAILKSGEDVITSLVPDDMKARVYGDAAVVTGRNTTKETLKGKDISGQYRWTDTWIKKAGRWQCVATHASIIVQK